ncbi:MAG: ABC transporter transmembrane domain-containing protein [Devosia sp.]
MKPPVRTIDDLPAARKARQEKPAKQPFTLAPLRRFLPFLLRYPGQIAVVAAFLLVSTAAQLIIPMVAGSVVDLGISAKNLDVIGHYAGWILVYAAVMAVAGAIRFYVFSRLGERVLTDMRKAVFDHLMSLDATFFDTHRVGELTSRLNGDVASIRGIISSSLSVTVRSFVTLVGAVILMFATSPVMASAVIVIAPIIVLPVVMISRRLRRLSRRTTDTSAEMSAMATEALGATRTVKSFVQEVEQSRQYSLRAEYSFNSEMSRLGIRAVLVGSVMFTSTAAVVILVWWGSYAVMSGQISAGGLTQFMIYALMATGAIQGMSDFFGTVQIVAGSTERLMEILDTKSALPIPENPRPFPEPSPGTIVFDRVGFNYATRTRDLVLRDVSFEVRPGETVALVGQSGAGKSTSFALLQRFYDVTAGAILVDGLDIREVDPAQLRRRLAYVEQEPTTFAGSIAENIRFGRPEATDSEVEAAAKAALVDEYVGDLEEGYDTIVGERGILLSGGQKQRLAIARAVLKDAPFLLLDEATSALDAQSEYLVQTALARLREGRTTLVIAHRLATIRNANRIVVLDKGRLVEQGTHDELVKNDGPYAKLARLQFRDVPEKAAE